MSKETKPPLDSRIGKDSPFTFGQRYLESEEDVFNHNAWDHVEWGEEQIKQAQELISKQYDHPVKEFDKIYIILIQLNIGIYFINIIEKIFLKIVNGYKLNSHHYIKSLVKLSTTNYNIRNWLWCWEYIFPNFKSK